MADFLEQEAEEATDDDEELTDDESGSQSKREKPKKKKPVRIDDDDEDEEEDELDEAARAELANFIQDEIEEVDDDMGAPADEGKRKHSDDELDMEDLEEDDYDLIEENLGLKVSIVKYQKWRVSCPFYFGSGVLKIYLERGFPPESYACVGDWCFATARYPLVSTFHLHEILFHLTVEHSRNASWVKHKIEQTAFGYLPFLLK